MKQSLRIATISGIKVSIHWTFFLLILWIIFSNYQQTKNLNATAFSVLFILVIFVCVILHEFGHALMAKAYGIKTRSIVLLPIGGVAQMEEFPEKPSQELWIAFAGPAVNIAIAGILYGAMFLFKLTPTIDQSLFINKNNFMFYLFSANIALAVFNLIPAFPMDGGRVLRAILSFSMNRNQATKISAAVGQVIAVVFVFAGIFYNPFLVLIGLFVYIGAQLEAEYVNSSFLLHAFKIKDFLLSKFYSLETTNTVNDAVRILLSVQAKDFLIMDGGNVKGTLSRDEIIKALSEKGGSTPVGEAMNKEFISFKAEDDGDKVYREIQKGKQSIFPVFDDGTLAGAVDLENITEFLLVNEAKQTSKKQT